MSLKNGFLKELNIDPLQEGILNNLTFAVKDVIDIQNEVTGCGNPNWLSQNYPSYSHAICVEQLLQNGAQCFGKAICGEFSSGSLGVNHFYGMPINPQAKNRIPGGSSSGSAAVVAENFVDFSLGTDAGGSVRIPAAFCNIFGFRPTTGIISTAGVKIFSPSLESVGIFAKDLDILQKAFSVFMKSNQDINLNNFYILEDAFKILPQELQDIYFQKIKKITEKLGYTAVLIRLEDIHYQLTDKTMGISEIFRTILCNEISVTMRQWIEKNQIQYQKDTFVDYEMIFSVAKDLISESFCQRELYATLFNQLLNHNNILCIPTAPDYPPLREEHYEKANMFNYENLRPLIAIASVCRLPQLTIPLNIENMPPLGLSFLGSSYNDWFVLNMAKQCF